MARANKPTQRDRVLQYIRENNYITSYPYKDETTKISDLQALDPRNRWAVEIITTDEPTGIRVVLSKSIEAESEEW